MPETPDPTLIALGSRIRQLREQRSMTIESLAEAAGLSVRGITYLEHGSRDPRYTTLLAVAAGLDVDAAALLPTRAG